MHISHPIANQLDIRLEPTETATVRLQEQAGKTVLYLDVQGTTIVRLVSPNIIEVQEDSASHAIIMRRPVLPEDEGRHFYEKTCASRAEAEEWIAAQTGEYFGPSDYYIAS